MEEIEQYLDRAIVDIARKCGVYVEEVIKTIKKHYNDENQFHKGAL